jgi:hypothetical protein
MLVRTGVTIAAVAFLVGGAASAQKPRVDSATVDHLVRLLDSSDPLERFAAFETLNQRPDIWAGKGDLLLRLVKRENDLMESTLRASDGMEGVSVRYGEEFGEYEADLGAACSRYCRDPKSIWLALALRQARSDVEAMRHTAMKSLGDMALPKGGYSAKVRATVDSVLLAGTRDPTSADARGMAVYSLTNVVASDPLLPSRTRLAIHAAFVSAALDTATEVRFWAVPGLALFADPADRPLLKRIAEFDSGFGVSPRGDTVYQIRAEAKRALEKLPPLADSCPVDSGRSFGPGYVENQDSLPRRIATLDRRIAAASQSQLPELLLARGRAQTWYTPRAPRPLRANPVPPPGYVYDESGAVFYYTGQDFRELLQRFPNSPLADPATYALTFVEPRGECEGDIVCSINWFWEPVSSFLRAHPQSQFADSATDRAIAAFHLIRPDFDLRSRHSMKGSDGWDWTPDQFPSLIDSLDLVGMRQTGVRKARLLTRAGELWAQIARNDRARSAYSAALSAAGAAQRACIQSRLRALPAN